MKQLVTIEVRPEIWRLLKRLAKQSEHEGVTPSVAAVVATLAESEVARQERPRAE